MSDFASFREIFLERGKIDAQIAKLQECGSDLFDVFTQVRKVLEALQPEWQGDAADAFREKLLELLQNVNTAQRELMNTRQVIERSAKRYYDAEAKALEIIASFTGGGSSGGGGGFW